MKPYKLVNGRPVPNFLGMTKDSAEYVTADGNVGVVILFKCASRSMVATGSSCRVQRGVASKQPENMHVFVRDPIQRLQSAYRFFKARPPIEGRNQKGNLTYEEFVDHVLGGAENPHWRPVTETLSVFDRSDIVTHLFENLADEYPIGVLEKRNVSKPVVDQEIDLTYREAELKEFYAGDYKLREEA